jgi:hypothetical protein
VGWNPPAVVGSQSSGRNDAVKVRMMLHFLVPGMEHAEEADLSSEVLGVSGDFHQRCGADLEQKIVNELLVLQRQRSEFVWQRKHDMRVRYSQQIA